MSFSLDNKSIVITGGGTGIGRGIALECVAAGARVIVTGRRESLLEETVERCRGAGGDARAIAFDVTDEKAVQKAFVQIQERFEGKIDALVNNAGVGGPNACADATDGDDGTDRWRTILATNLDGTYFCSREALKAMPKGGRIVNISSVLGQFGVPGYTAYCASKHGVVGFTKALALEVAPKEITCNAICPGWVETEMARDGMKLMADGMGTTYEEARKTALSMVPLGRILEPREIGQMVVYLCSEAGGGITSQAFSICGGQVMNG
ncbi:MAG: SDR family NAD(P)-dependent oxidoreductase [Planctomycetota bacterium]